GATNGNAEAGDRAPCRDGPGVAAGAATRSDPARARASLRRLAAATCESLGQLLLAEVPRRVDRRAEVQALVLRLLDQHHGLEGVDVVDPLLLALGGDLRLVRPVVELHLRDAGDLADLTQVELDLVEVLREIDGFEKIDLPTYRHYALTASGANPV